MCCCCYIILYFVSWLHIILCIFPRLYLLCYQYGSIATHNILSSFPRLCILCVPNTVILPPKIYVYKSSGNVTTVTPKIQFSPESPFYLCVDSYLCLSWMALWFCCHVWTCNIWIISLPSVHDRYLVLWNELIQYSKSFCAVLSIWLRQA